MDRNNVPRTQKEVGISTGFSKSTISMYVKQLLDREFIVVAAPSHQNKIYAKGKRYNVLESQINAGILEKMGDHALVRINRGAVPSSDSKRPLSDAPLAFKVHIPGAWCMFSVLKEGELESAVFKEGYPPQTIFGKNGKREKSLRGSEDWDGTMVMARENGSMFYKMRYQRTKAAQKFYINITEGVVMGKDEVQDLEAVRRNFIHACFPLLAWLEKYAGWMFLKDGTSNYEMLNDFRLNQLHYVGVGPMFDKLIESCGGKFGVSGEGAWIDESPGHPEAEFGTEQYTAAVVQLPQTTADVGWLVGKQDENDETMKRLNAKLADTMHVLEEVVEIQNVSVKALSNECKMSSPYGHRPEAPGDKRGDREFGGMYN